MKANPKIHTDRPLPNWAKRLGYRIETKNGKVRVTKGKATR